MEYGEAGLICPTCGRTARSMHERDEPVIHDGRRHGWSKTIRTYVHDDGTEHRVPLGVAK